MGFAFNNFFLKFTLLKLSGIDGIIPVFDASLTVPVQHFNKSFYRPYFKGVSQIAPLIENLFRPGPLAIDPNVLYFFLKNHYRVDYLV